MIQVSKEEMQRLRKRWPNIRATRTVHKYYVDEVPRVMAYIRGGLGQKVERHA